MALDKAFSYFEEFEEEEEAAVIGEIFNESPESNIETEDLGEEDEGALIDTSNFQADRFPQ